MSYTLLCGNKVIGVLSTPRNVRKALQRFAPNIGIKIRENYRPKKSRQTLGVKLATQSSGVSYVPRRKPVTYDRPLLPGQFKL